MLYSETNTILYLNYISIKKLLKSRVLKKEIERKKR